MRSIEPEQILRINCPGYGMESHFTLGTAMEFKQYRVIVVNPTSVAHLFDKDPNLLHEIDQAQQQGMTSYSTKSDSLLQSIVPDLKQRHNELIEFLDLGGLLVYFLCPPFRIESPNEVMDNYCWLDDLAPDKPQEKNKRHMSAVGGGKHFELADSAEYSAFALYLKQPSMEWHTLIREENLSDGYEILATAGNHKCVSARKKFTIGSGQIMFLPAPYQKEYDEQLTECIELWHSSQPSAFKSPEPETNNQPGITSADNEAAPYHFAPDNPDQEPTPVEPQWPASAESYAFTEPPLTVQTEVIPEAYNETMSANPEEAEDSPRLTRAKEFMRRMVNIGQSAAPEWCLQYSFSDLDSLRKNLAELNIQLETTQLKIQQTEEQISELENLKNALLWAEEEQLRAACMTVFEKLGFACNQNGQETKELWLSHDNQTSALSHIMRSSQGATRLQLAQLAESVITYWGEHGSEPKGILVASTWADLPPVDRKDNDYTDDLNQFAEKKHLCLVTSAQLLCIYRDLTMGKIQAEEMRNQLLATNGRLPAFSLEKLEFAAVQ